MSTVEIFKYKISKGGLEKDVEKIYDWIAGKKTHYMACANPHSLVIAEKDGLFKEALKNADLLVPDGTGVVLALKILKTPVYEKVAGYDLFIRLSIIAEKQGGLKYFFLGSSNSTLDSIRSRMIKEFPSIEVSGMFSPPFKDVFDEKDNRKMIDIINKTKPDVLWVGMTAPKQEKWIYQNKDKISVPFIGAVGAVFDYYGGTKIRASIFMQKIGLEWLPRLIREPKRMWRRMFISAPVFVIWVLREKIRQISR